MESLWRRILSIFAILTLDNAAVLTQNVPAGLSFWSTKGINSEPSTQQITSLLTTPGANGICPDITSLLRASEPERQRGMLQDGFGTPVSPSSVSPQAISSLTPPILYSPQRPVIVSSLCPGLATAPSLSETAIGTVRPLPSGIPVQPISSELSLMSCPLALGNQVIPMQQLHTLSLIDNNLPSPVLPEVYRPPVNMQQNLSPPIPGSVTVVPVSQPRFIQVDNFQSAPVLPELSAQLSSFQTPLSYPPFLSPGTATIIPIVPQNPIQNSNNVPMVSDVHVSQSGYQVTVFPSVLPVQTAPESVASSGTYSYTLLPSGMDNSQRLPINYPEKPAPIPMPNPLFAPAPIIVVKSGSSLKNWLPSLMMNLLTSGSGGQDCGCCCCSSCDSSDNVYYPYPIAIPTNNPIILSDNSLSEDDDDDDDNCD